MTVTVRGIIQNAGEEELNGTIRVTANKNFTDSNGDFHITSIPFTDSVISGEFSIILPATKRFVYTTASFQDSNNVILIEAKQTGVEGNDITITIEDGTNPSTSKLTVNIGLSNEEIYDNTVMDDTSPDYLVDLINNNSSLIQATRLSDITNLTLPGNQTTTNLTGGSTTNLVKYQGTLPVYYKFEFLNEYGMVYLMLDKIELEYQTTPIDISDLL